MSIIQIHILHLFAVEFASSNLYSKGTTGIVAFASNSLCPVYCQKGQPASSHSRQLCFVLFVLKRSLFSLHSSRVRFVEFLFERDDRYFDAIDLRLTSGFELEEIEKESRAQEKRFLGRTDGRGKSDGAGLGIADFSEISQSSDEGDSSSNRVVLDRTEFVLDQTGIFILLKICSLGCLLNLTNFDSILVAENVSRFRNANLKDVPENAFVLHANHVAIVTLFSRSLDSEHLLVAAVEQSHCPTFRCTIVAYILSCRMTLKITSHPE